MGRAVWNVPIGNHLPTLLEYLNSFDDRDMEPTELIEKLFEIATIKHFLPTRARVFSNELGLYVQMGEAYGMASLKAGSMFRSRIHLWRESRTEPWEIKKYRPGEWECLVEPTLRLVNWLAMRGGVTVMVKGDFEYAIKTFRATGELELPERIDSILDNSILGRLLEPYSDTHGNWDDTKAQGVEHDLLRFLEVNPVFAPAWQALMRAYSRLGRYQESLEAIEKAINIAPYEAEFRWEVALIYITAIKNAIEPDLQLGLVGRAMTDRTLFALDRDYEEACAACIEHLTMVSTSGRPDSERYKGKARWVFEWCMASPEHRPDGKIA